MAPRPLRRRLALLAACLLPLAVSCGRDVPTAISPDGTSVLARATGVRLTLVSGGGRTGMPAQALANPIVVRVTDQRDRPVAGATVNFLARNGAGHRATYTPAEIDRVRGMWEYTFLDYVFTA